METRRAETRPGACAGPGSVRQHDSAARPRPGEATRQPIAFLVNGQYISSILATVTGKDNMMPMELKTPRDVQRELAGRFKARRLGLNLTQEGLATRSGVSWSSLKRFERNGLIAFDSLLKLALVLNCLGDFEQVCADDRRSLASKSP